MKKNIRYRVGMFNRVNMSIYFLCSWLFSIYLCTNFLNNHANDTLRDQFHTILVLMTYGAMYQAPAMVSYWLLRKWQGLAIGLAVTLSVLGHGFVFIDSRLFDLYAFHINGFVWNLITSSGGIESLGADQTNLLLVTGYLSVLAVIHLGSLLLSKKLRHLRIPHGKLALLFLMATLAERGVYAYSKAELYGPVLDRGDAMALYQPMSMNSFLGRLGIEVKQASKISAKQTDGQLEYPKSPIALSKVAEPPNIVMLVSESMRWDLLTPGIMPNLVNTAKNAWNFTEHFSGGNGTRQGLFALFYGVPGNNPGTKRL